MKNLQIDEAVNNYKEALERFKASKVSVSDEQVLEILNARDMLHAALSETTQVPASTLKKF